jgi:hypothetical protein
MTKKGYILIVILMGVITLPSLGQKSSQATMRVSANVIEATTANYKLPADYNFSDDDQVREGRLVVRGIDTSNTLVQLPQKMSLNNGEGNQLNLNIQLTNEWVSSDKEMTYQFEMLSADKKDKNSNSDTGDLETTIVYL